MQRMLLTLLDGTTVFVRPISPEDKPLLGVRAASCSAPETAFRRFLSPKTSFSAAELRYLTEVDQLDHIALVAVHGRRRADRRGARRPHRSRTLAELAIVVGDPWQGRASGDGCSTSWPSARTAHASRHDAGRQPRRGEAHARLRHARGPRRDRRWCPRGRHTCRSSAPDAGADLDRVSRLGHQRAARRRPRGPRALLARCRPDVRAVPVRAPRRSTPRCSAAAGRPSSTAATARTPSRRRRRSRSCGSPTRTCRSSPSRRSARRPVRAASRACPRSISSSPRC